MAAISLMVFFNEQIFCTARASRIVNQLALGYFLHRRAQLTDAAAVLLWAAHVQKRALLDALCGLLLHNTATSYISKYLLHHHHGKLAPIVKQKL